MHTRVLQIPIDYLVLPEGQEHTPVEKFIVSPGI